MPTEEVLTTDEVNDLNTFVSSCKFPEESFVLLEEIPSRVLTDRKDREGLVRFATLNNTIDLSTTTSGRIFHTSFEIRWQRETSRIPGQPSFRVVYVGVPATLPAQLPPGQPLGTWGTAGLRALEPRSYFLFGTILSNDQVVNIGLQSEHLPADLHLYAEVRVPRLLYYPLRGQRLQLIVQEYVDKSTGQIQLLRFAGLKVAEEDQHESL
jgi:hypothetical protein